MADEIIAARVRELLDYNPQTGEFTRKIRTAQRHHVGDRADFLVTSGPMQGYRRISFDGERYLAHRIAWLFEFGSWPENDIDHINGKKGDNAIANLRDVPNHINRQNMRCARVDNKHGLLGIHLHQGKWRSKIQINKQVVDLGMHDTPELAHDAYVEAKRRLHEGCTI